MDAAGQEDVDGNTIRGNLVGECFRPSHNGRPDSVGNGEPWDGLLDAGRRQCDDPAPSPCPHRGQKPARQVEQVCGHHLELDKPVRARRLDSGSGGRATGIVDDNVNAALCPQAIGAKQDDVFKAAIEEIERSRIANEGDPDPADVASQDAIEEPANDWPAASACAGNLRRAVLGNAVA